MITQTKEKIAKSLKDFYVSHPEARQKISEYNFKTGKVPPSRLGIKVSKETKAKMSASHMGAYAYNFKGGYENRMMHVRLRRARMKGAKGAFSLGDWQKLKISYNNTCPACGKKEPTITLGVDHVIPLVLGGNNTIENIQPLCRSCNSKKKDKLIPKYTIWRG